MADTTFQFSLLTPTKELFSGAVRSVHLSTDLGELELLPGHASLVGTVSVSRVKVLLEAEGSLETFLVRMGSVSFDLEQNTARLVAYTAESIKTANRESLKEFHKFILDMLSKPESLNNYQIKFLESESSALERSIEIIEK